MPNMNRVRNIAIYYIVFGVICAVSFVFFDFYWIAVIGVLVLIYYYVAKYIFKVRELKGGISKTAVNIISMFFIVLPPLSLLGIELYYHRPFKQKIVVPKNYEGVVVVGYGAGNIKKEQWDNGYRLINVDNGGLAKTKFKIPKFISGTLDATLIYYNNDLNNPIPVLSSDPLNNDTTKTSAYIVDFTDEYQVYILTKNYKKFFVANTYNKPDSIAEQKITIALNKLLSFKQ
jgi:energy-coupling factor transporter transmembrane protein EcfT